MRRAGGERNTPEAEQGTGMANTSFRRRPPRSRSPRRAISASSRSPLAPKESYSNAGFNVLEYVLEHVTGSNT